ncbi:glutamate transport system permease protein [Nocardioides luteus]|uniref:Glutamate ABC transporter permease n=1 Tax=Nocardioides luteus TaxID=1844 RepID=A0ABQ5T430_9ACTN|nr:amino acid ABC transporter permease [Nocardioides luteus]MDR7313666.1 glutamate transport system permease protein [Nocardioides luteus]GGR64160.1 glutamate ABC transporter permease [Nocardioides luteus]GLJ70487.1 glutamate ABC transporter permease [Nocardioides luteus]
MSASVLYDAPGPRAKKLNWLYSGLVLVALLFVAWLVFSKFKETGQWEGEKWTPFIDADVWNNLLIPGLLGTLRAFAVGSLLALAFGFVFAVGRLSPLKIVSIPSAVVVEFFRSIPMLLLMFFIYFLQPSLGIQPTSIFWAVVLGLMLYNGSVIAEIIRAGVHALPKGQSEAGSAIGLTSGQVMRTILLPQAVRSMLPAIIAQLVVLLKDTALGYVLGYSELLNQVKQLDINFHNLIPAAIVVALIYIVLNTILGLVANWIEARTRRVAHTAGPVGATDTPELQTAPAAGMPSGIV